jgi:hypothetical protein
VRSLESLIPHLLQDFPSPAPLLPPPAKQPRLPIPGFSDPTKKNSRRGRAGVLQPRAREPGSPARPPLHSPAGSPAGPGRRLPRAPAPPPPRAPAGRPAVPRSFSVPARPGRPARRPAVSPALAPSLVVQRSRPLPRIQKSPPRRLPDSPP